MNLDEIQESWRNDAIIDVDNLHVESIKIPQLHAKYYNIYNNVSLLKKKSLDDFNKLKKGMNIIVENLQQRFILKNHFHIKFGIKNL